MRIMMVILDNRIGGISIRAMAVADKLSKYGIDTFFALPNEPGNLSTRVQGLGLKVKQIALKRPSLRRPWVNIGWLISLPISIFLITRIISKEKIDIIHVNGLVSIQAPIAAMISRKKVVWHLANTMYPQILVKILMPLIQRISFIITISESVDEYYCNGKFIRNKRIVREPVDLNIFNPTKISSLEREAYRKHLGGSERTFLIGVIGNIVPVKGHEYLIKALPSILEEKKIKLIIVGATFNTQETYNQKLRSLVNELGMEDRVTFLGQRDDVPHLLAAFDIFVLPSLYEGTPIAILEAMAMEKPVIATRVGGVQDLVVHTQTGLIVDPEDSEVLALASIQLINNTSLRVSMGKMGRLRVEKLFSLESCVEAHKEIYRSIK